MNFKALMQELSTLKSPDQLPAFGEFLIKNKATSIQDEKIIEELIARTISHYNRNFKGKKFPLPLKIDIPSFWDAEFPLNIAYLLFNADNYIVINCGGVLLPHSEAGRAFLLVKNNENTSLYDLKLTS